MTKQLSGVAEKLAYRVYLAQHFPRCVITEPFCLHPPELCVI